MLGRGVGRGKGGLDIDEAATYRDPPLRTLEVKRGGNRAFPAVLAPGKAHPSIVSGRLLSLSSSHPHEKHPLRHGVLRHGFEGQTHLADGPATTKTPTARKEAITSAAPIPAWAVNPLFPLALILLDPRSGDSSKEDDPQSNSGPPILSGIEAVWDFPPAGLHAKNSTRW